VPVFRDWRNLPPEEHTRAERVMHFIEKYIRVPEGKFVGQPLRLAEFQESFLYAVYDNPHLTRRAILSMARKNAKTALIAAILLAHLVGPERHSNSQIVSGAMSRDQAALIHSLAAKMVAQNAALSTLVLVAPSAKRLTAAKNGSIYKALSADAATAHGLSPRLVILDEAGQIVGPTSPFVEALTSAQGAYDDAMVFVISTQAANDADMLSLWIDEAEESQDPHTVCHVYAAPKGARLDDESAWAASNPALDLFRSRIDLQEQLQRAARMPSSEASARNLLLNQRVTTRTLFIPPSLWKECATPVDADLFYRVPVALGLDLSQRNDLTAAVMTAKDERGTVHTVPFVFIPEEGIEERALRDKAPYAAWVRDGLMWAVPGRVVDYEWVAQFLAVQTAGMVVAELAFDRWGITSFKQAAQRVEWDPGCTWAPVGQGYKDMSPRLRALENALLAGKLAHGGHPLLNMAVSNAIATKDPAGNIKLDKAKTSARIDPLVALVMSAFSHLDGAIADTFDVKALIG
jgi:phage terminase large subunit-like protein